MCYHYGQTRHVKKNYPILSSTSSVGQSSSQPWAPAQGFGRSTVRPLIFFRSKAGSNSGAQGDQQPHEGPNSYFVMTVDETQANLDTVTSTMLFFSTPTQALFDSGSSRSFVRIAFAYHADQELAALKNKLVVTTPLGE